MTIPAYDITVSQTLALLDSDHTGFARGIGDGRYMFFLGSGISRGAVPGLDGVVLRVLEDLQAKMTPGDLDDRFRTALIEILSEVAQLTGDEWARVDLDEPAASWPDCTIIVNRLTQKYALMLNVDVEDEDIDYLLWHGVRPAETYGDAAIAPDVEHLCLAILGLEGAVSVMASANWDGLVEAAMARLVADAAPHLGVVVLAQDVANAPAPLLLLKFHGCAVLAATGDDVYRKALVGRQRQITDWPTAAEHRAIRTRMISEATGGAILMLGFSAQDGNIQNVFSEARAQLAWAWPSDPPALIFAEDQLGEWQKNLLKVVYGDAAFAANRAEILRTAQVRAFGKALLTALVLDVLTRKAHALIRCTAGLSLADADALCDGVTVLRDTVAMAAGGGAQAFMTAFLAANARAVSLFDRGVEPPSLERYDRLTMLPAGQVTMAPSLDSDGVRELAVALALLGRGAVTAGWTLDVAPTPAGTDGALRVTAPGGVQRSVVFTRSGTAAVELRRSGPLAADPDDAIVIHCDDRPETPPRSPSSPPGRTGIPAPAELSIRRLLRETPDLVALQREFCLQAGLPA